VAGTGFGFAKVSLLGAARSLASAARAISDESLFCAFNVDA
jgi:hypothetical protein